MRRLCWHWAISAIALVLAVAAVQRFGIGPMQWYNAIWIAPVLGLLNLAVGLVTGIVTTVFGLANLLTLGLLGFAVSFVLYSVAVYWLGHAPNGPLADYLPVTSLWGAVLLAAVMGLFSVVLNMVLPGRKSRRR